MSYHNSLHANCSKPPNPISTMTYFFSIGSVSMTIINFLPEQHSLDNLTYNIKEKKTLKTCGNHSIMPKVSHSWSVVHQVRDLLPIQIFVEHGSSFFDVLSMFYSNGALFFSYCVMHDGITCDSQLISLTKVIVAH